MGGFSAQVQSPQTTGGKGNPISDSQQPPNTTDPGPGGLTILGPNDVGPKGKGAGGGVGAMAPSTYDPSVVQRRFANNGSEPMVANVSPAVNKPDFSVNTFPGPSSQQPQGKGAASTNSATSGQPRMGKPNNYANTVGGWDNASIRPQGSAGKGKGG